MYTLLELYLLTATADIGGGYATPGVRLCKGKVTKSILVGERNRKRSSSVRRP